MFICSNQTEKTPLWLAGQYEYRKNILLQKDSINFFDDINDKGFSLKSRRKRYPGLNLLKQILAIIFLSSFMIPLQAMAGSIGISRTKFAENGGDLNNIAGSIALSNYLHVHESYRTEFLTLGKTSRCSATWLGDSSTEGWSYLLLAAHCIDESPSANSWPVEETFISWDDSITAQGQGTAYIPDIAVSEGINQSTDIIILKLPKIKSIVDKNGSPLENPIIYDGDKEVGKPFTLVGYGIWEGRL